MTKPVIRIAVVSDVVCPWCYIGKRRLEKAVSEMRATFDFDIVYYPFELNPDLPQEGVNSHSHLVEKFGSEDSYERLTGNVTRVAADEGLLFDFAKQSVQPNTRHAHRMILYAREHGRQLELVERLFKAYFTDGIDLSKHENLADIAADAGLDRDKMMEFLNSSAGSAEVALAETELQRMGITGVPFYIINDKYGVSGAQPAKAFREAFVNIGQEMANEGQACKVGDENC